MKETTQFSVAEALFAILRQELGGIPCPQACLDIRLQSDLLALAEQHSLAHILANAYANAGLLEGNPNAGAYRNAFMLAFYQSQQQSHVLEQVSQCFDRLSIDHIPLKGAVIRRYYPQSWMRSSCDVDILIPQEDAQKAMDGLLALGYRIQKSTSFYDYSLFSPQGVHLELHFSLIQLKTMKRTNQVLEQAWAYTRPDRRSLTDEMFMVYHLAHMAKHFINGGCGIRPFLDLWLFRDQLTMDAQVLDTLLRQAKLLDFYHAVNDVVDVWFEGKPHSRTTLGIQEFILTGGSYGTQANVFAVRAAEGESRLQSFLRVMFMSRANLEYMYPRLERYPWLLPYYQVKRWFGFFSKKRRNHLKRLTNTRGAVTKTQADSTADLLTQIGLSHQ